MKTYYVYILRCRDGTYYTGITNDVDRRFAEHDLGIDPTCYTFNRRPVALVWAASYTEVLDAIALEKKLKGWSHAKKSALIRENWPLIKILSRNPKRPPRLSR